MFYSRIIGRIIRIAADTKVAVTDLSASIVTSQSRIDQQVLEVVYKVQLRDPGEAPQIARPAPGLAAPSMAGPRRHAASAGGALAGGAAPEGKVGRNDPCPCGSGRKYKKCHGAAA